MSTKANGGGLKAAEEQLAELQETKRQLQTVIASLEKELAAPDLSDVNKAVSRIASNQTSLEAAQQALMQLQPRIQTAESAVDSCLRQQREEQATAMRVLEKELYHLVATKLVELNHDLQSLDSLQGDLWSNHNLGARWTLPGQLRLVVFGALEYLRMNDPEAIGMPPKLSPKEMRRREAEHQVERMAERVKYLKRMSRESRSFGWESVLADAEIDLKFSERALEALG